jgi:ABC-type Mn2+/Zn2+ transport system ATPase subunit
MIAIEDADFGYGKHAVIHCAGLEVRRGSCLGIYGSNGSGKSTLLRGIAGVLAPLRGKVVREAGVRVSLVPQRQGMDSTWPMTAADAAGMAVGAQRFGGWLTGARSEVLGAMEVMGVRDLARRSFAKLSGGQQQRILLAGALACRPSVLLLDEPAEGLDAASTESFLRLLKKQAEGGVGVVVISHELSELAAVADRFAFVEPAARAGLASSVSVLTREAFFDHVVGPGRHVTMVNGGGAS